MKRGHIQILSEFIEGLNIAIGASSSLVHTMPDHSPKWFAIRDMLNVIRDAYIKNTVIDGKQ